MKVLFRCDASAEIGSGHVMRCLTLADALALSGARVTFVCRQQPGDLAALIELKGYPVHRFCATESDWEADADRTAASAAEAGGAFDWLVVDHYRLDARFERRMRLLGMKVLAIDDLADRPHDSDILLDQNLYGNPAGRYRGLVPPGCRTLIGPGYALLRPEFIRERQHLKRRFGKLERLLISFGGSDPTNETGKALAAMELLGGERPSLDVVIGSSNPHAAPVGSACAALPRCTLHTQVENMAQLMSHADLALGSGGSTTWERCVLGLPTLAVVVAPNQLLLTQEVAKTGAVWNLGWHAEVTPGLIADRVARLQGAPDLLAGASERCFCVMGEPAAVHPLVPLMHGEPQ